MSDFLYLHADYVSAEIPNESTITTIISTIPTSVQYTTEDLATEANSKQYFIIMIISLKCEKYADFKHNDNSHHILTFIRVFYSFYILF